ncbi:MAG TPA: glycosyltransferase [Fimbriimonadaceae bacterium]|jgi:glycosyltransferase involved in cell wall biosynthesis
MIGEQINNRFGGSGANKSYGIVAFSHLRWDFVWQRPQQFLSRFANTHPVLFIEEPEFVLAENDLPLMRVSSPQNNITVARMILPTKLGNRGPEFEKVAHKLTQKTIDDLNSSGAFNSPLLWFYNPMDTPWAVNQFNRRGVVYDCMDELSQFKFAPANLVKNEQQLLATADIVFTGGYELWLRKQKQHLNTHFFGCGVEYDHFAKAQLDETPIPADLKNIEHPILGWFGVIDERMDYDLVAKAAELKPEWHFVLAGPIVKVDPNSLPQGENIHWVGQKDYAELPSYCKAFDICMMCFAINDATEFINPTKALEYLATGTPVISTPVKDVVRQYKDFVDIAETAEQFVTLAEQRLNEKPVERIQKGISKAQQSSWETTVARMQELIEEAVAADDEVTELPVALLL